MSGQIAHALEEAAEKAGQGLAKDFSSAYHDILKDTEHGVGKVADHVAENEAKTVEDLGKAAEHPGGEPHVGDPHAGGGAPTGGEHRGAGPGGDEPGLGAGEPGGGQGTEGNGSCQTGGDPVDVVSGQMITSDTDLELPGLLPVVLRRAYASGYVGGTLFGPGWSATLTQRVQVDRQGIHYAGDDGQILHYPVPTQPGQQVYPEDGARWPLTWDRADDTIRVQDPETGWTRHFPALLPTATGSRPITALTDRNGHLVEFLLDEVGLPKEVCHSGGYRVAVDIVHTSAGPRIEALRLLDGTEGGLGTTVRTFGYDAFGRLTDIINSSGLPLVYAYDDQDRITSWTDRNGHWYAYEYGSDGRVVRGHGPGGTLEATFEYDPEARITTVTNSLGHQTAYHYDAMNHITAVVDPVGRTVRTEHDRYGRLLSHTDPLGRTTRYLLDAHGEIVRVEHPDGSHMSVSYDELRLPTQVVTPGGACWRQEYDQFGRRVALIDPTGATTGFGYNENGSLAAVTDSLGRTTTLRNNPVGLAIEVIDPLGGRTAYHRDPFGRPIAATDALGNTTRFTWTVEGRITSITGPDGTAERWTYDAQGNALTYTDQNDALTTMKYTHFNLLSTRTEPDGARHAFEHDTELRLSHVTNPQGGSWSYSYDPIGLLVHETDFDGRTISYTHDAAGQLTSRTNSVGQTAHYGYDLMGNLVSVTADDRTCTYVYDRDGRLTAASAPHVELSRHHDAYGRLMAETVNGRTLQLSYDRAGQRVGRRTPSGAETLWAYDAAGNVSTVVASGHEIAFERDLLGRETTRRLGQDLALSTVWDKTHRRAAQCLVGGPGQTALHSQTYAYRANGDLAEVTDLQAGIRRFTHDSTGRVVTVQAEGWSESYAYDSIGNLTSAAWPNAGEEPTAGERTLEGGLVRQAGRTRYEYDSQGRLVVRRESTLSGKVSTWHFSWDAEDHLTELTAPDGSRWRYLYDPLGRRVAKQHFVEDRTGSSAVAVEWTDFTWDGPTLAEQTAHGSGLPGPYTLTWDHQGLHPISQTEQIAGPSQDEIDRRFFAIVTDLVGTPTHLVDPDGTTAWRARTALWGTTRQLKGSSTSTPLRFPGQYYDAESRLHYNHHRYYDPAIARYLTPDPLGLAAGANPHAYVSNPHTWTDSFGLAAEYNPVYKSRGEAFNEARIMAGIPRGLQPVRQWTIGGDPKQQGRANYVYRPYDPKADPDKDPRPGWGRYYQYDTPDGARVIANHTSDPRAPFPHFHAGKAPEGEPRDVNMQGRPYKQILPKHHLYYDQGGCGGGE